MPFWFIMKSKIMSRRNEVISKDKLGILDPKRNEFRPSNLI
jgi:hypothetical protein